MKPLGDNFIYYLIVSFALFLAIIYTIADYSELWILYTKVSIPPSYVPFMTKVVWNNIRADALKLFYIICTIETISIFIYIHLSFKRQLFYIPKLIFLRCTEYDEMILRWSIWTFISYGLKIWGLNFSGWGSDVDIRQSFDIYVFVIQILGETLFVSFFIFLTLKYKSKLKSIFILSLLSIFGKVIWKETLIFIKYRSALPYYSDSYLNCSEINNIVKKYNFPKERIIVSKIIGTSYIPSFFKDYINISNHKLDSIKIIEDLLHFSLQTYQQGIFLKVTYIPLFVTSIVRSIISNLLINNHHLLSSFGLPPDLIISPLILADFFMTIYQFISEPVLFYALRYAESSADLGVIKMASSPKQNEMSNIKIAAILGRADFYVNRLFKYLRSSHLSVSDKLFSNNF